MGCHVRILRIHGAFAPVECQLPHPLRTYDAVHLATALTVADLAVSAKAPPPIFATADRKLLAIAQRLGLPTANPEDHP